jgi:hypothetical protein
MGVMDGRLLLTKHIGESLGDSIIDIFKFSSVRPSRLKARIRIGSFECILEVCVFDGGEGETADDNPLHSCSKEVVMREGKY